MKKKKKIVVVVVVVVEELESLAASVPFVKLDTKQKKKKIIVQYDDDDDDDDDPESWVWIRLALFLLVSRHKDLMGVEVVVLEHYMMLVVVVAVIEEEAGEGYTMWSFDARYEVTYAENHLVASTQNGTHNRPNIELG